MEIQLLGFGGGGGGQAPGHLVEDVIVVLHVGICVADDRISLRGKQVNQ